MASPSPTVAQYSPSGSLASRPFAQCSPTPILSGGQCRRTADCAVHARRSSGRSGRGAQWRVCGPVNANRSGAIRGRRHHRGGLRVKASANVQVEGTDKEVESGGCPFSKLVGGDSASNTPANGAVSAQGAGPMIGEAAQQPLYLDQMYFLASVVKAATNPTGMAGAMLEWSESVGLTVGIEETIMPGAVATVDPKIVEYVCHTNAPNYRDRLLPDAFRYVTKYKGLTGSQGEYNRKHRQMCQKPFMNQTSIRNFAEVITERVEQMLDYWQQAAEKDGGRIEVDMNEHSQRLTLDIISLVAFNHDFRQVKRTGWEMGVLGEESRVGLETDELLDAYNISSDIMGKLFITPVPLLKLGSKLGVPIVKELEENYDTLERVGMHIVNDRRKQLETEEPRCLLDLLILSEDEDGNKLSDDDLWGDVNDIMAAGHRTQASNMTVTLYHVARDAEIERRILEEVAQLGDRPLTYEDVTEGRLKYTQQVVKEGLRKYAPINLFPRVAEKDDVLPTGHKVKKGDYILLSSYAMGRCKGIWEDPMRFNPDRFSEDRVQEVIPDGLNDEEIARFKRRIKTGRDFLFTPFGAGPRSCIGATFALISTTILLASCVRRFRFEAVDPNGPEIPLKYDTTIVFPQGVYMGLTPRA